ncbi:MAG: DUF4177 domain-containing protein [Desulfobulbus sp.]|nr:DUF4177 domain-containing protein [Desulfobulbus sp.]
MLWQYQTVLFEFTKDGLLGDKYVDDEEIEKALNQLGGRGWELVNVTLLKDGVLVFLKKPVHQERQVAEQPYIAGISDKEPEMTMGRQQTRPPADPEPFRVEPVRAPEPVYVPPQYDLDREPVVQPSPGPVPHVPIQGSSLDDESDGIGNIRIR